MKKLISLFAILAITTSVLARDLRTPQMPRGLTADKSNVTIKNALNSSKKISNRKIKRKGLQGYSVRHHFSDMDFDELMVAKNQKLQEKNWDIAVKYLDRMIKLCDDVNQKASLVIELADLLFQQEKYEESAKWFSEFIQLYPGNPKIEYASYKAIVCASKEILSIDRDQSSTEKALSLSNDFLKRDLFTTYKKEVAAIQQLCQETLAQNDCYVAEFYLKGKSYTAAERRLKGVRSEWVDKVPEITPALAVLETTLAQEYPEFKAPEESIVLAQAINPVKKTDMTARF
jgi:outer membrane assembly lipoprotein YfiO